MTEEQLRGELLACLDYAETALSEAWEALRRIRDGEPDPDVIASDLLFAHGFEL